LNNLTTKDIHAKIRYLSLEHPCLK